MSIYKPCDIRGHARELSGALYRRWGRALGMRAGGGGKFVVGGDVRDSTPAFLASLVEGLCDAGMDVVNLGAIPTPMVHYAKRRLDAEGCAAVTSSHGPADTNGLKWMLGDCPPSAKEVGALKEAGRATPSCRGRRRSTPRTLDISFDYVAWLQEVWMDTPPLRQPVVLDAMYGAWSCRARRYLQAIFPHTVFLAIHDAPSGTFGGCAPDCSVSELLGELAQAVEHEGAALGIAFDGDGDRVSFVDNEGAVLTAEEATWLFLQSFGPAWPGERFVYDVKFSDRVAESALALGAEPVAERSGHAFLRNRMLKSKARFGAEVSGHYFFRDLACGDDGMFAACWLIDFLARSGRRLSDLRRGCPAVYITPDLRVPVKTQQRTTLLRNVREAFAKYPQTELDGVRVNFPNGWALARGSGTEAAMTFRFESKDWSALTALVSRYCDALPTVGETLWASFQSAMGPSEI